MKKTVLITGGAGFIGSHLCDELLEHGYKVRVLDNLSPQVHGDIDAPPAYLNKDAEFMYGDVRDNDAVLRALNGIDAVFHFAAAVGVGQSMYEIEKYTSVNNIGTAVLIESILKKPVEKMIVASSMSIYGEGLYMAASGDLVENGGRKTQDLKQSKWELYDSKGFPILPIPTPETKRINLSSIYALSKYDQERMFLIAGEAYGIPAAALRFFNVYGTRQALSNPYTGVLAIFASRYLNNNPPVIYEDGEQKRDFVSVYDIARACRLALETHQAKGEVFNIGSGNAYTINEIARQMSLAMGKDNIEPVISQKYRAGDIRHCFSDISKAKRILNYEPQVPLEDGLAELADWLEGQIALDLVDTANSELIKRG
ncbi:MAG TPA: SDR family NAD(P)-dependent oxidoreductase, partial [Ignavibacteriales bacterium]|nr:SDR family NAD(P)-dependent oxidoreductase [Ignavibacteriales bacterium]